MSNLEALVEHDTISAGDLELFIKADPLDGVCDYIVFISDRQRDVEARGHSLDILTLI